MEKSKWKNKKKTIAHLSRIIIEIVYFWYSIISIDQIHIFDNIFFPFQGVAEQKKTKLIISSISNLYSFFFYWLEIWAHAFYHTTKEKQVNWWTNSNELAFDRSMKRKLSKYNETKSFALMSCMKKEKRKANKNEFRKEIRNLVSNTYNLISNLKPIEGFGLHYSFIYSFFLTFWNNFCWFTCMYSPHTTFFFFFKHDEEI